MNEGAPFIIESKFVNNVNITTFNVHVPIHFYLFFFLIIIYQFKTSKSHVANLRNNSHNLDQINLIKYKISNQLHISKVGLQIFTFLQIYMYMVNIARFFGVFFSCCVSDHRFKNLYN